MTCMRAVVYGDVSLNIIDGSSVWLVSVSEVLARVFDEVHVVAKVQTFTDILTERLSRFDNVFLHGPVAGVPLAAADEPLVLDASGAASRVAEVFNEVGADLVLVRGFDVCLEIARAGAISRFTWAYVTDLQFPPSRISERGRSALNKIASECRGLFAQTEAARSYLEALAPAASGKTSLMPPMVPDEAFATEPAALTDDGTLRVVYSGKFASDWRTLEMLELPRALRARGVESELWVVGDKFQKDPAVPLWHEQMRSRLEQLSTETDSGVRWLGAVSRSRSLELMRQCQLGFGWRSHRLEGSLEVSTKALEYGATGLAPIINRTSDHVNLYGPEYPFYVQAKFTVDELAKSITERIPNIADAARIARAVSDGFSMNAAAERLEQILSPRAISAAARPSRTKSLVVATHDMKFMGELMAHWEVDPELRVSVDHWPSLRQNNAASSEFALSSAETIFCEWAGPNLAWYSQRKREGQRLIARLHGFELRGHWWPQVEFSNVDLIVCVSDYYRRRAMAELGLPSDRVRVIPNIVDPADLSRPKRRGSEYHLGMVGWVGFGKRPDRALEILEKLLAVDDSYILHIKGRMPWEYPHEWDLPVQRQLYLEFFGRLKANRKLQDSVAFEEFSPDMGSWLRKIGFVLSTSDFESFHLAPAEGMAAGSLPVILDRPGAREIFGDNWTFASVDSAVGYILSLRDPKPRDLEAALAKDYARRWSPRVVLESWEDVIKG